MTSPVIVPVEVKAYMAPLVDAGKDSPQKAGYFQLHQTDPAHQFFEEPASTMRQQDAGVYVHWQLPEALRRATNNAGALEFPAVPNRWLVIRYLRQGLAPAADASPAVTYWVVESDYCEDYRTQQAALTNYAEQDPETHRYYARMIGRTLPFDSPNWVTPDPPTSPLKTKLTAVGPGLATFSVYRWHNQNVFSMHDDLEGIDQARVDYQVFGWYSTPADDILAGSGNLQDRLAGLGWAVGTVGATAPDALEARSVYAGTTAGVIWDRNRSLTLQSPHYPKTPVPAVGHDTADALSAVPKHLRGAPLLAGRLFEAFLTGRLDRFEEEPGGLAELTHSAWFDQHNGGYVWDIVDKPGSNPGVPPDTNELKTEQQWLTRLNQDQGAYDVGLRQLFALQQRLHDLWLLTQPIAPYDDQYTHDLDDDTALGIIPTDAQKGQMTPELDPNRPGSLASQVKDLMAALTVLRGRIPYGETAKALAQNIADFARGKGLKDGRELQRASLPAFRAPIDPVVVVTGAEPAPSRPPGPLLCRTRNQLIASYGSQGSYVSKPGSAMTGVPYGYDQLTANALATEGMALSWAGNQGVLKADVDSDTGFKSASGTTTKQGVFVTGPWEQPWNPLFLVWTIKYYPLPYNAPSGSAFTWSFDSADGRYHLKRRAGDEKVTPMVLSGRSVLTSLADYEITENAAQHARIHSDAPTAALEALTELGQEPSKRNISQTMTGFNRAMLQRVPGLALLPPGADPGGPSGGDSPPSSADRALATLMGSYTGGSAPWPNNAVLKDFALLFNPVRSGQFFFDRLTIVDSMGQACVVQNSSTYPPRRAESVTPDFDDHQTPIIAQDSEGHTAAALRYIQLPPRLLQPARLRFDYVAAANQALVVGDPPTLPGSGLDGTDVNPVIGWLLPNHLSKSLLVHLPDGRGLVEGRAGYATGGTETVLWSALPDSPYTVEQMTGPAFQGAFPQLAGFLRPFLAPVQASRAALAFKALLASVDCAHTTRLPDNDGDMLAALAGRPVALLRARLAFGVDTLPPYDPSFDAIVAPTTPSYLKPGDRASWRWNVRLGDPKPQLLDGLIGYFTHPLNADGSVNTAVDTDYTTLRTRVAHTPPGDSGGYIKAIDAKDLVLPVNAAPTLDRNGATVQPPSPVTAYVTLLADPFSAVNAVTDLLPISVLRLPEEYVRGPLSALRLAFRTGPLLASTRPDAGSDQPADTMVMPVPSAWTGSWDWHEPAAPGVPAGWRTYSITPPDTAPHFDQPPPANARTGYLTLTTPVEGTASHARDVPEGDNTPSAAEEETTS